VTQLRKKMLEELQGRKTLCHKLSLAEIKGVSVTGRTSQKWRKAKSGFFCC
jgi:hypothetical protein